MVDEELIPSIRLDATIVGKRRCYDAWREAVRPVYDVEPLSNGRRGQESFKAWLADNLIFTEFAFSRHSFSHRSNHTPNANYLSLQIYKKGGSRGVLGDIPFEAAPGDVLIFDFSQEYYCVAENSVVAGVVIPYEAVGYEPGLHQPYIKIPGRSAIGQILAESVFALMGRLPYLRKNEAHTVADGFRGMVRGLSISGQSGEGKTREFQYERRAAMRSYLESHLTDPDLGVEHLCQTFGVSRPSIYRDFADAGGVAHYITRRRLERIFYQLLSAPPSRGRVQEIASRWGFGDAGYFSKVFRRHFGISPTAALKMGRAGRTPEAGLLPAGGFSGWGYLGDWLKYI